MIQQNGGYFQYFDLRENKLVLDYTCDSLFLYGKVSPSLIFHY